MPKTLDYKVRCEKGHETNVTIAPPLTAEDAVAAFSCTACKEALHRAVRAAERLEYLRANR